METRVITSALAGASAHNDVLASMWQSPILPHLISPFSKDLANGWGTEGRVTVQRNKARIVPLGLRVCHPQTCHKELEKRSVQEGHSPTLLSVSLNARMASPLWQVCSPHLETEGHPCWQKEHSGQACANKPCYLFNYPKPKLCLDSALIGHPKPTFLCPAYFLQMYSFI